MKDIKSLQLTEDRDLEKIADEDATIAELKAIVKEQQSQIEALKELCLELSLEKRRVLPAVETAHEKLFRKAEEGRSPEQLKWAENWIIRQMGGRLTMQQGPEKPDGTRGDPEVIFDKHKVTQAEVDAGNPPAPLGWTVNINLEAWKLSRFYMDIILDEETYESDAERLLAIVQNSKERGTHTLMFAALFDAAGQLKPLRRRRRGKRDRITLSRRR